MPRTAKVYGKPEYLGKIVRVRQLNTKVKILDYSDRGVRIEFLDPDCIDRGWGTMYPSDFAFELLEDKCIKSKLKADRTKKKKKEEVFSTQNSRECYARELRVGDRFKKLSGTRGRWTGELIPYSQVCIAAETFTDSQGNLKVYYRKENEQRVRIMNGHRRVKRVGTIRA